MSIMDDRAKLLMELARCQRSESESESHMLLWVPSDLWRRVLIEAEAARVERGDSPAICDEGPQDPGGRE